MYDQIKDCIWYISLLCSLLHIMDMHKPLNFKVIYKFLKSFIRISCRQMEQKKKMDLIKEFIQYIWLRDNSQLNIYRHSLFSMKMDTYKYSTNYQHHEHAESKLPY